MDAALRKRTNEILHRAYQEDWSDTSFSLRKAHVCAELSALVYEDVQPHELKKNSRIHLFASDRYREIVQSGTPTTFFDALVEGNFEAKFFVVRGRYAVILGTVLHDVVILAIRGTIFTRLWAWKGNIDARRFQIGTPGFYLAPDFYHHDWRTDDLFFHRGFFESIVPQFRSIAAAIEQRGRGNGSRIVWTGHSLGGAMAAIGGALAQGPLPYAQRAGLGATTACTYTFGMPRYGGLGSVCLLGGPHHVYRPGDLVPTLPLRKMGYADCAREYAINETGLIELTERMDTFGVLGHVPRIISSIKAHSIESYADSVAKAAGVTRP